VIAHPLAGRRVAVLRAGGGVDAVRAALVERGADAATVVVADVADRPDDEVRERVGDIARYRVVAVTSRHAARRLALWAGAWPSTTRIAAVGPQTTAAVEALGLDVDVVAPGGTARSLAEAIGAGPVLFLAAASARGDLASVLAPRGVEVVTVIAYDVVARRLDDTEIARVVTSDAIVAMAPIAIDALRALDDAARADARRVPLVAIGPTTAARAEALDWPVAAVAAARDPASVCAAVAALAVG
jgi:uroporphyrinogen-III synthase